MGVSFTPEDIRHIAEIYREEAQKMEAMVDDLKKIWPAVLDIFDKDWDDGMREKIIAMEGHIAFFNEEASRLESMLQSPVNTVYDAPGFMNVRW